MESRNEADLEPAPDQRFPLRDLFFIINVADLGAKQDGIAVVRLWGIVLYPDPTQFEGAMELRRDRAPS